MQAVKQDVFSRKTEETSATDYFRYYAGLANQANMLQAGGPCGGCSCSCARCPAQHAVPQRISGPCFAAVAQCDAMHMPASQRWEWRAAWGPPCAGCTLAAGGLQHEADTGPDCSAEASTPGLAFERPADDTAAPALRSLQSS